MVKCCRFPLRLTRFLVMLDIEAAYFDGAFNKKFSTAEVKPGFNGLCFVCRICKRVV